MGRAWSNSLFEDNAEFGFGMRLAVDKFNEMALELLDQLLNCSCASGASAKELLTEIKNADQSDQTGIEAAARPGRSNSRQPSGTVQRTLPSVCSTVADYLVKKSVWMYRR